MLRLADAAPGPTTHDNVTRVLVDISIAATGQPFYVNFELTKLAPDVWRAPVPLLPRDQQLHFVAHALDATGVAAFSGDTLATLATDNQSVQIPLAPAQNNQTFQLPRMFRIVYPTNMFAGQEEQVTFTIEGNAGQAIAVQITPLATPTAPAAEFSPATGTVTLTNTVADFMTVYAPPSVTVDTDFTYQVTITAANAASAVAITTNFTIHVKPRPTGTDIAVGTQLSVLLNPVILSLTANGSEIPNTIELFAAVSDDSAPDKLTYQWSFVPNTGTPTATFVNNGQGTPGLFQGYTLAHQGTITLAVTDENGGTTTLNYQLTPNQFANAIDHPSVDGLKRIVIGNNHTCLLAGAGGVRCWGDNQFGQLGYGNAIDVGDKSTDLPFTAGDVPLPALDPVQQLVAGNNHTCVLLQSGLVYCWGDNQFGQLGYGRTDNLGDGEPVTSFGYVTLGGLATVIAAGGDHTCAILQSGALRCWGRNDSGQLGRGNTNNIGDNETVYSAGDVDLGAGVMVKDLALGGFHTCALLTTRAVRCWGRNDVGQLGYGNTANLGDNGPINNLQDVSLTGTVRKVMAGDLHTCALTFAGTLRCWGQNLWGALGQSYSGYAGIGVNGGNQNWGDSAGEFPSNLPNDINVGSQVTDVVAGDNHTCALSSDGQLRCWGRGDSGQLGYGNTSNLLTPQTAGVNLDGVSAYRIAAGAAHTCALRNNGTARCWGANGSGQLGRGSTASSATATGNVDIQIFAPPPQCGNGVLEPGEQCDDGNQTNGDACDNNCTTPRCGNGIVDPGEQCDDGNSLSGDGCENNCTLSSSVGSTAPVGLCQAASGATPACNSYVGAVGFDFTGVDFTHPISYSATPLTVAGTALPGNRDVLSLADGSIISASFGSASIHKISATGMLTSYGSGLNDPHGLIQMFDGNVLIGDVSLSVWTPNGTLVRKLPGTISTALWLSQMSTGEIWYSGNGANHIVRLNPDGSQIDTISDPALVCQSSGSTAQLAAGGYVVVCNSSGVGGKLIFLNPDRTAHKFAQAPAGMTLNADGSITHPDLAGPIGVIQLPNGDLLVAGCNVTKLIRLHSDGSYIDSTVLGSGCSNNGCPFSAFSVTLDHRGRILMGMGDNQVRVAQFQ